MGGTAGGIVGVVVEQIGSKAPQQMNASEGIEGDAVAAVGGDSADAIGGDFADDRSRSCGQGNVIHQGRG